MAASFVRRFGIALGAALAATALAVPMASAKSSGLGDLLGGVINLNSSCGTTGTQVFSPWGDTSSYFLAPNGGFESGSTGWSLSGASVVYGNQPFFRSGSHSLSLPSGSTATSPATCIGSGDLYVRMFGADQNGTDSGLRVRVVWYGLLNTVLGLTDVKVFDPGSDWSPTDKLDSAGGSISVPILPLAGSTSARVQVTPVGSGSRWLIDDLYIDPMSIRG